MRFTRRGFLSTVLGAVSAGSFGSVAVPAEALTDPVTSRYARLVQLQQALYATNREMVARASVKRFGRSNFDPVTKQADELFGFMLTNFPIVNDSVDTRWAVHDVLNGRMSPDVLNVNELKKLLNEVLVVAVARHVIVIEKCRVSSHKMQNFMKFAELYEDMILSIGTGRPSDMVAVLYPEQWKAEHFGNDVLLRQAQARWTPDAEKRARARCAAMI